MYIKHNTFVYIFYVPYVYRFPPFFSENMRFFLLPCGGIGVDSDTVWNEMHTYIAARTVSCLMSFINITYENENGVCISSTNVLKCVQCHNLITFNGLNINNHEIANLEMDGRVVMIHLPHVLVLLLH